MPYETRLSARLAGRHTLGLSIFLHLLPGLLTGVLYYLLALPVARLGLPSIVALMVAGIPGILVFELGVVMLAARKGGTRPLAFKEMIPYRQPLPVWRYLVYVPAILIATVMLFTATSTVTRFLQSLFAWLPSYMQLDLGTGGSYPRNVVIWVTVFNALLTAVILPIVEEIYFRGFLLPRMPESIKGWTPLLHSLLFALYHFWSPYMLVARTVGLLPLIYAVRRERNINLGIFAHCLVNFSDVAAAVVFLIS